MLPAIWPLALIAFAALHAPPSGSACSVPSQTKALSVQDAPEEKPTIRPDALIAAASVPYSPDPKRPRSWTVYRAGGGAACAEAARSVTSADRTAHGARDIDVCISPPG